MGQHLSLKLKKISLSLGRNRYNIFTGRQPVDCQWSAWSQYSQCSKSCDGGIKRKTRHKTVHESNGGVCDGSNQESRSCSTIKCSGNLQNHYSYHLLIPRWKIKKKILYISCAPIAKKSC